MKKIQKKINKLTKKAKLQISAYFSDFYRKIQNVLQDLNKSFVPGRLDWAQVRIVILMGLIIFTGYVVMIKQYYQENFLPKISHVQTAQIRDVRKEALAKDLQDLVNGHPIEEMIPFISDKDRKTAAYIIGIAKKESAWGERKPVLNGEDCYNYWGFRAKRERMGSGGHTCFDTPKEAVDAVATRIDQIIERNDAQSAKDMIVWKCGSDCSVTGGQAAADKWITDVDMYAKKVLN